MKNKISVAPMVDRTDRHFRNFVRMINKDVLLYTEMVTAQSIINGDLQYILGFDEIEHPIALQVAITNKKEARESIKRAEEYNYDEINLNVGCPSDRVSGNMMGAYLMAYPEIVCEIIEEMKKETKKPITVKHRIGIDGCGILPENCERKVIDKYEDMKNFINIVEKTGVNKFIIHSRIAILKGLNPKENREIPPLRYEDVYKIKKDKPYLHIEINGGIKTIDQIDEHLKNIDSVMIGREIYDNPFILTKFGKYYNKDINIKRSEIIEKMLEYVERMEKDGKKVHHFLMHTHGLFHGINGSKFWKRAINNSMANSEDLKILLQEIKNMNL